MFLYSGRFLLIGAFNTAKEIAERNRRALDAYGWPPSQ
jgi:hypothetical protein